MQERHNLSRRRGSLIRAAAAAVLLAGSHGYANILSTSATVRPNNSLLVDVQVISGANVERVSITYQTAGVDPLVSRLTQVSSTGSTTIAIGRLRANRTYTYTVDGFDRGGGPAGTATGSFATGSLPPPLLTNTYALTGRTTAPLVIVQDNQAGFRGWVGLDLHSSDAPQIVWYDSNVPSNASGVLQVDTVGSIVQRRNGDLIFGDAGTGGPTALDTIYTERESAASTGPFLPRARPIASSRRRLRRLQRRAGSGARETTGTNTFCPAPTVSAARSSTLARSSRTRSSTLGRLRRASGCRRGAPFAAGTPRRGQTKSCGTPSTSSTR